MTDSVPNRVLMRKKLDLILAKIENGIFDFVETFPHSNRKQYFSALEGGPSKRSEEYHLLESTRKVV